MAQRQSIQNTIKTLQARTDNIQKILDKGNKSVVIQIGSHTIKIGFANDKIPHRVRTLIAYKVKTPQAGMEVETNQQEEEFVEEFTRFEGELKDKGVLIPPKPAKGKPKSKMELKMKIPEKPFHYGPVLYDEQALWVQDNSQYILKRPIKHGLLNIELQPIQQPIQDLINIIHFSLRQRLKIKSPFNTYTAVLVLPDIFCRPHIKLLIQQMFLQIGFKAMYMHTESVMACFSSTISSGCIVDIGYEKINVACVEEGVILPGTLIRKNFGGKQVNEVLKKTIERKNGVWLNKGGVNMDEKLEGDMFQFNYLKEIACYLEEVEELNNRVYQLFFLRKGKQQVVVIPHSQFFPLAPHSLFSTLFNTLQKPFHAPHFDYNSKLFALYHDPQDYFQQFSGGGETIPSATDHPYYNVDMSEPFIYNSLQDIIAYSIANVKDADMRKRMLSNVLLVGGTAHTVGLTEVLQPKLLEKMMGYDNSVEKVEFIDLGLREIQPIYASWLGGAVVPKLDVLKDLWIEKGKFIGTVEKQEESQEDGVFEKRFFQRVISQQWGMSYLKEKLPFQW